MSPLTKKQSQILTFIDERISENGYAPSYREIATHFGFTSTATVHQYIKTLLEKGYLRMGDDGEARSIEIIHRPTHSSILHPSEAPQERRGTSSRRDVITLPLMGLITAGVPIEAVMQNETMAVPADLVIDGENSFVLRVKGQSMIEDGILDGDYVVIERNPSPKNGDVVVALLDNAYATLKRFYLEKNRIRLQPANRTMEPIYVQDCIVQGIVRAVIRKFQPA